MKKIFLFLLTVISLMFLVSCIDTGINYYYISVKTEGDVSSLHFDLLVNKDDFDEDMIYSEVAGSYISEFPTYQNHDYLDLSEEYISYCAFVKGASCYEDFTWTNDIMFGDVTTFEEMNSLKLIYFNDEGDTEHITDIYKLKEYNHEYMQRIMYFNVDVDSDDVDFTQNIQAQSRVFFLIILSSVFIFIGSFINALFYRFIGKGIEDYIKFYISSIVMYYLLCFSVYFLPIFISQFALRHFVLLIIPTIIQILLYYYMTGRQHKLKRIIVVVCISQIFTFIWSLLFYLQGYSL